MARRRQEHALAWHIIIRANDHRALGQTADQRLFISRRVLELSRPHNLLVFRCADTHLHHEAACSRTAAGQLAHDVGAALTLKLKIDVGCSASILPVRTQSHLSNLFDYILDQEPHHGTFFDPYHEASNLPDMVGLRVLGRYTANVVRQFLPRITRAGLLQHLKLDQLEESPESGPQETLTAALAAAGLVRLDGSTRARHVRQAVVSVVGRWVPERLLASLLGVSNRTIRRWRGEVSPDPVMLRAVRLQVTLRRVVQGQLERWPQNHPTER